MGVIPVQGKLSETSLLAGVSIEEVPDGGIGSHRKTGMQRLDAAQGLWS
jgi:hypothetical protein